MQNKSTVGSKRRGPATRDGFYDHWFTTVARCLSPLPMVGHSRLRRSMLFLHSVGGPQGPEGPNGRGDWAVEASGATEPMMVGVVIRRY